MEDSLERFREYWSDPKYVILLPVFRQINYTPLDEAVPDLDIAMYWLCEEAAPDIDYNIRLFHSAKDMDVCQSTLRVGQS